MIRKAFQVNLQYLAMILVRVFAPVCKNDVRVDARLEVLDPAFDFASLVGEEAVFELGDFDFGSMRPCQKCCVQTLQPLSRALQSHLRRTNALRAGPSMPLARERFHLLRSRCRRRARPNKGVKAYLQGVQVPVPSFSRHRQAMSLDDTSAAPPWHVTLLHHVLEDSAIL